MSKNNQDGPMTHELEEILTFDPTSVTIDGVRRQSDEFHPSLCELGLKPGEGSKLRGTDRCIVFWMGEQHDPVVANKPSNS